MPESRRPVKRLVVLTVDDHPLIRSALHEVLCDVAKRVELVEASNPEEGLALLRKRSDADLVFLDLNFGQHEGLHFVERFRTAAPLVPLIIFTMHEDVPTLKQALAYGAAGVIPKTHPTNLLQKAIELVLEGGVYLPAHLAQQLAGDGATAPDLSQMIPAKTPAAVTMSPQQWKILALLAQGSPNKDIARKLGVAFSTVKNQLTIIFQKLDVSNRTQAAMAARALMNRAGKARRESSAAGPEAK
jgi:DNA-binding NarL/FixJ family response regulator